MMGGVRPVVHDMLEETVEEKGPEGSGTRASQPLDGFFAGPACLELRSHSDIEEIIS